ncbi:MAG: hypothetical protein O3B63_07990, partial [Bacteroidetes bacterium]|nr:hypothetical protein [Bacteroidota bacterium]
HGDQSFSEDDLPAGGRRRVSWRDHPKLVYRQMSARDDLPAGGRRRDGLHGDRVLTALPRRVG